MSRPDPAQLESALNEAARMREQQQDPHFVAHVLLSEHARIAHLERVLASVKHYLHSGLAPHEHSLLEKAIEEADLASRAPGETAHDFGLENN